MSKVLPPPQQLNHTWGEAGGRVIAPQLPTTPNPHAACTPKAGSSEIPSDASAPLPRLWLVQAAESYVPRTSGTNASGLTWWSIKLK